ncbi:MAG: hypothetical protein LBN40_02725 [Oscillospiraceae bacterium]|nr:hypothetical protein [Oscillospiraceae bacterium]
MLTDRLVALNRENRLPSSLLITAASKEQAIEAAKVFLCEHGTACGECLSCHKATGRIHPDLIDIAAMLTAAKKPPEAFREAINRAVFLPNDGELKVYLFLGADELKPLYQNALLKFLEEPPSYVRIIVTAESKDKLPATLQSRLTEVRSDNEEQRQSGKAEETAAAIMNAIKDNSEYRVASLFYKVAIDRDRLLYKDILDILIEQTPELDDTDKRVLLTERLLKLRADGELNPQLKLCAAESAALLHI